jgi:hypothetical protein
MIEYLRPDADSFDHAAFAEARLAFSAVDVSAASAIRAYIFPGTRRARRRLITGSHRPVALLLANGLAPLGLVRHL